jgi:hypothetical protein
MITEDLDRFVARNGMKLWRCWENLIHFEKVQLFVDLVLPFSLQLFPLVESPSRSTDTAVGGRCEG